MIPRLLFRKKLFLSKKPYVLLKAREDGEAELEALAAKAKLEGAWLYAFDTGAWINLTAGYSSENSRFGVSYQVQQRSIDLTDFGKRFTHYHTHPRGAVDHLRRLIRKHIKSIDFVLNHHQFGLVSGYEIYKYLQSVINIPSSIDIKSYFDLKIKNPYVELDFVIISPFGYTITRIDLPRQKTGSVDHDSVESLIGRYRVAVRELPDFNQYTKRSSSTPKRFDKYVTERTGGYLQVIDVINHIKDVMNESSSDLFNQLRKNDTKYSPSTHLRYMIKASVDALIPIVGEHQAIHLVDRSQALLNTEAKLIMK